MTGNEVNVILSRIASFEASVNRRFDAVDGRLDAGDKRFEDIDLEAARTAGARKMLIWIGSTVIAAAGAVGSYFASYVPDILKWLLSSRG